MNIDDILEQNELEELLQNILNDGYIDHPTEIGIVKKIINQGIKSLSDGQHDIFERYIKPYFEDLENICKRCQTSVVDLALNERYTIISTGYCPLCHHRMRKDY